MNDNICNLYNKRYTQKEIAKKLNISVYKVRQVLKEKGFDTRILNKVPEITKSLIIELLKKGRTYHQITEILDISIYTVKDTVRNSGVKQRDNKERKEQKILEAYRAGLSIKENVKVNKVSNKTVRQVLIDADIIKPGKPKDKEIIDLFTQGYNISEICNYLRVPYRKVLKNITGLEQVNTPTKKLLDRSNKTVLKMYSNGVSIPYISKKLKLKTIEVEHIVNKQNK